MKDLEKEKEVSEDELKLGETKLQDVTDKMIDLVNEAGKRKEKEVMEV